MNRFIKILTSVLLLAAMLTAVGCNYSSENSGNNPSQQITSNNTESGGTSQSGSSNNTENGSGSSQSGSSSNTDGQTEATANEYKIYFSGIKEENVPSDAGLSFDEEKQTYYAVVKYGAAYTLPLCVKEVYKKTTKWKKDGAEYPFSGTYSELTDIILSPVWEDVRENEKDWSKWY